MCEKNRKKDLIEGGIVRWNEDIINKNWNKEFFNKHFSSDFLLLF